MPVCWFCSLQGRVALRAMRSLRATLCLPVVSQPPVRLELVSGQPRGQLASLVKRGGLGAAGNQFSVNVFMVPNIEH